MRGTLTLYERFTRYPFGTILFSRALAFRVPYVSTIHPDVTGLRSGYCQVEIKDRRSIRNHLGSVNAGALCLLGELTGGLAVEATLPLSRRFITKEMTARFIKQAKGNLVGTCSVDPGVLVPGDVKVPVEIKDGTGDTVLDAMIVFYISERKSAN